ncbi:MAG TPA: glycosyltransferase [Ignavibacteria bacterium]|nr:glycosyltransferase [Ignavibacteria bacterium]
MKIIIIGTAFPMRGAMAQLNGILANYLSENNEVEIYSFKRQYPKLFFPGKSQEDTSGVNIIKKEIPNTQAIDSINPFNWYRTAKDIATKKPDLLILRFWIPFFAPAFYTICKYVKKKSGCKVLFICDNVIPHEHRFGDNFLIKLIFKAGDFFIIHSKSVEEDLKKYINGKSYLFSPHPVYNIFGKASGKKESREFIKNEFNIDLENEKVILFFGFIRKYKGLNFLIDAMPRILEKIKVKLLIVGEFYEDESITKDHIQKLKLEKDIFLFSDYVPNEQVKYFFCAADCVVLPYIDATQSGITQIAYFYNKPVIASDVGGLSEVVLDNKTGFTVEPGNSKALSEAVIKFYEDNLEEKFSLNTGLEKEKYSWEKFIDSINSLVNTAGK